MKTFARQRGKACLHIHATAQCRYHAQSSNHILGRVGIAPGKGALAHGLAVLHGQRVANKSPTTADARPQVILAWEQRALHVTSFREQSVIVGLTDFEPKRDLENAHRGRDKGNALPRQLCRHFHIHGPDLRPIGGVGVKLGDGRQVAPVDAGAQAQALEHETVVVQGSAGRGVELVVRVLLHVHIGLNEARKGQPVGSLDPGVVLQGRIHGRLDLARSLGFGGLTCGALFVQSAL
jgi:hypothetical protein